MERKQEDHKSKPSPGNLATQEDPTQNNEEIKTAGEVAQCPAPKRKGTSCHKSPPRTPAALLWETQEHSDTRTLFSNFSDRPGPQV